MAEKISDIVSASGIREQIFEDVNHSSGIVTRTNKMSISDKDAAILMDEAKFESMTTGGWSSDRNVRKMGEILLPDFLMMAEKANAEGRDLGRADFAAYFADKTALRIANNSRSGIQIH